jgi:hypothetical protein
MKILRITRHQATEEQIDALQSIFGADIDIDEKSVTVNSVRDFDNIVQGYDVVEAVLPVDLLAEIFATSHFIHARDGKLIRANMEREVTDDGVVFTFSHYEHVKNVSLQIEPL